MKLVYPAVFSPLEQSEGYCVTFPDLPGCVTQGNSLADAIDMAVDAASGWVLDELEDGKEVPKASRRNNIVLESKDDFVNLIVLDMDAYAEKCGSCVTPWTAAHQAPQSLGFSRQEHWSGLPCPPPMHESEM